MWPLPRHGVARGCSWCTCIPRAVKKNVRLNLQGKCVSAPPWDTKCTPRQKQESIFRTVFAGRVRFGGVFRRSLRATIVNFFGKKKCTPRQNPGYAYVPRPKPVPTVSPWLFVCVYTSRLIRVLWCQYANVALLHS